MAVPRHSHTRAKVGKARMHKYIKICAFKCLPKMQKTCFITYSLFKLRILQRKEVINVLAELTKKDKKQREKEIKEAEKESKQEKPLTMEDLSTKK